MASDPKFVQFVCDQMAGAGEIRSRKMFGDYAVYCDEKVVALVGDNQLFVKPTPLGRELLPAMVEAPPYPGAKPHFLIEDTDDSILLTKLISLTASQLPTPKPKAPRKSKRQTAAV